MTVNNKKRGTVFEHEMVELLRQHGFYAHLNVSGVAGQSFDIQALKNNVPYQIECKTCKGDSFPMSRLEANQRTAFELLESVGCPFNVVMVKFDDGVRWFTYSKDMNTPHLTAFKKGFMHTIDEFWEVSK